MHFTLLRIYIDFILKSTYGKSIVKVLQIESSYSYKYLFMEKIIYTVRPFDLSDFSNVCHR